MFKINDISQHQGVMYYDVTRKRANQGLVDGVYIRASIGVREDSLVDTHVAGFRDVVERPWGLYHYYSTGINWLTQLDTFSRVAERVTFRFRHVLDLEAIGNRPGPGYQADVLAYLTKIMERFGHSPIIYTGPSWIKQYLRLPEFALFDLWIANYQASAPQCPLPFSPDWLIWQYGQADGPFYGTNRYLSKAIDVNVARELPVVE